MKGKGKASISFHHLSIDHVTIAWSALAPLEQTFANLGLATDYGGLHSNGITHMALLGFEDGSYLELISSLKPGQEDAIFWGKHIVGNGGPCAWAVRVDDVAAEAARLADLGITVKGPAYYHRRRPDGVLVEWDLAFLGDHEAGATLPFLIKDITPRDLRVRPSASAQANQLTGLAVAALGVENLETTIALFQHSYGWPAPQVQEDVAFGAKLACFKDTPVVLAAPLSTSPTWLSERLARFGPSPCAYLIAAQDFELSCQRFGLVNRQTWFERQVAWFDPVRINGIKLGLIN